MVDLLMDIAQQLINGLMYGAFYALIGIEFTIFFGVMKKFNLAYGPIIMLGMYSGLLCAYGKVKGPGWLIFLACVLGSVAAGLIVERVCFRYLRKGHELATFGFGEIVRFSFLNLRYQKQIGERLVGPDKWEGFRHITYIFDRGWTLQRYLGVIYAAVVIVAVLVALLERSKLGAMFRAVEEDEVAASMVGINVTAVKVFAFAMGGLVAGLAGALFVHYSTYIDHDMVALPLAVASVTYPMLGGLGSFWGAIITAAFLMFLTESLRFLQEFRMIVYGSLIILTMTFRPRGIIDETLMRKVQSLWHKRPLPATVRRTE